MNKKKVEEFLENYAYSVELAEMHQGYVFLNDEENRIDGAGIPIRQTEYLEVILEDCFGDRWGKDTLKKVKPYKQEYGAEIKQLKHQLNGYRLSGKFNEILIEEYDDKVFEINHLNGNIFNGGEYAA